MSTQTTLQFHGPISEVAKDEGAWAELSADRSYRYELGRRWGEGPLLPWIMLNPSTADALKDDPNGDGDRDRDRYGDGDRYGYGTVTGNARRRRS